MDFELEWTKEQEEFRQTVKIWLEANAPQLFDHPDPANLTEDEYLLQRKFGRDLGARGWLYPTMPAEYGGGGLPMDLAMILEEELDFYNLALPPYYDTGGKLGSMAILVWGEESQKSYFLPQILSGEIRTWQLLTEPESGSDLASIKTTAIRDGEDYVVNGTKIYVGSNHGAEYSWTIVVTNPNGERHKNLGWLMIPMDLPGITVEPMDLLFVGGERGAASGIKNTVFFDNVRVPRFNLIGGENNGWKVASTHLEIEHGLLRSAVRADPLTEKVFNHAKITKNSNDPYVKERLVDFYIDTEVTRLLHFRNYAWRAQGKQLTYEGAQAYLFQKRSQLTRAKAILDLFGSKALIAEPNPESIEEGHIEIHQRSSIVDQHPGGTAEIQRVIIARRLGIGRSEREEPGKLN